MAGQFMTDFIKPKDEDKLPQSIQKGIALHRKIDDFTDHHPEVQKTRVLLYPTQGKYTPVLSDIVYDYYLIQNWNSFSEEDIHDFTKQAYKILSKMESYYPTKLRDLLPLMIDDDFLLSCKNTERLNKTMERLSNRTRFPNNFSAFTKDLNQSGALIERHFMSFFPELIQEAQSFCATFN